MSLEKERVTINAEKIAMEYELLNPTGQEITTEMWTGPRCCVGFRLTLHKLGSSPTTSLSCPSRSRKN
jgi:hypothetical protein